MATATLSFGRMVSAIDGYRSSQQHFFFLFSAGAMLATTENASQVIVSMCSGYRYDVDICLTHLVHTCSCSSGPYQFGVETPNMMSVIPGADVALAFLMHVDNRGPQTAEQVNPSVVNATCVCSLPDVIRSRLLKAMLPCNGPFLMPSSS